MTTDIDPVPARKFPAQIRKLCSRLSEPRMGAAVGIIVTVLAWEVLALIYAQRQIIPTPASVLVSLWSDRALYPPNLGTTLTEVGLGWLVGNLAAIILAVLLVQMPAIESEVQRVALTAYCLPIVAVGPILQVIFTGTTPKTVLAGLAVFFTTMIAVVLGLRSASQSTREMVTAFGGTRWQQLWKVRVRAALPAAFGGLQIAAPMAVLGAMVGEYLGGTSGLGVMMINAQRSIDFARTWGIGLVATAVAGTLYAITGYVGRWLTPWLADERK